MLLSTNLSTFRNLKPSKSTLKIFDQYLGVYASTQMPLKITITKGAANLVAQATGQPAFPLDATAKDKFEFEMAGLVMEFKPTEKTMVLKQGGGNFFSKKNRGKTMFVNSGLLRMFN